MSALTWLALAVIVVVYYVFMQDLFVSIARHRLFRMRDELFDQAMSGQTSFESPEYQAAREQFNKLIRFTHALKWQNILFLYKFAYNKPDSEEANSLYEPFRMRAALLLLGLVVIRSPLLLVLTLITSVFAYMSVGMQKFKKQALKFLRVVEVESYSA